MTFEELSACSFKLARRGGSGDGKEYFTIRNHRAGNKKAFFPSKLVFLCAPEALNLWIYNSFLNCSQQ